MASVALDAHQITSYDDDVADFRRDLELGEPVTDNNPNYYPEPAKDMDEEIKITKKRKPIAKLDAERLLSESGIPELRRRATKRMKLRGKGNEFEDMSNLLQMYQMWLDDMYPKAKFRDGLAMIEKVGHTKRLNVMRREWITATRPGQADKPDDDLDDDNGDLADNNEADQDFFPQNAATAADAVPSQAPSEDDLDALLAQEAPTRAAAQPLDEDDPDPDDLDALLGAEAEPIARVQGKSANQQQRPSAQDDYADDEEAMNEMGVW